MGFCVTGFFGELKEARYESMFQLNVFDVSLDFLVFDI